MKVISLVDNTKLLYITLFTLQQFLIKINVLLTNFYVGLGGALCSFGYM